MEAKSSFFLSFYFSIDLDLQKIFQNIVPRAPIASIFLSITGHLSYVVYEFLSIRKLKHCNYIKQPIKPPRPCNSLILHNHCDDHYTTLETMAKTKHENWSLKCLCYAFY